MEVLNIQSWNNEQVLKWFKGLDESIQRYETHFRSAGVVGSQLLNLSYDDLYNLRIHLIGHQELILDAVSLLQQLDYGLDLETLQSRALCLKCRCRSLRSSVSTRRREAEEYEFDGGVSLQRGATNQLLHLAADVLDEGKQLILWLDRSPFNGRQSFQAFRDKLVNLGYELSVTMQQSVFACVIEDAAMNICTEMENCADGIVQSNDSLTIQPVSLEQIHLRDVNPVDGLGLFIKATFEGHHVVTGTRPGSVAARARRIMSGDEVVAVNAKTVVGWTLASLVAILKEQPNEVLLLVKKRPQLSRSASSSNLLNTLQRGEKDRAKIFRVATPIRRIEDPSKSHSPASSSRLMSNPRLSSGTWSSHRSHDPADDVSSELTSRTSGSDMSDRWPHGASSESRGSFSNNFNNYSSSSKHSAKSLHSRPQISVDESSPMEMLKFPPPPAEPYSPKTDSLAAQQTAGNRHGGRSPSPNSILDIEQKRRYTVIGGSTDQGWYDDFITQVNNCRCQASSKPQSQEKLSSNEEVFATTPVRKQPDFLARPASNKSSFSSQRHRRSDRPLSMPPDYYHQVNVTGTANHERPRNYQSSKRASANYHHRNVQTCNHTKLPVSRQNHNFNNNNNRNNREKLMVGESPSKKTPPKPPPRSSSIQKLNHRLSTEIQAKVEHTRQCSLPEKSNYSTTSDTEKRQHPLEKPAIPRKPKVSQVKQFILGKGGRSKSTPHLQQGREDEKISAELTASTDRIKDPEFASGTSTPLSKDSSADSLPRPIPKPRQFGKTGLAGRKSLESGMPREKSSSHNDLLDAASSLSSAEQRRRKSAGHVPRKGKSSALLTRSSEVVNEDGHAGPVTPPVSRPLALARSSPTRLSYTEAIKNEEKTGRIITAGDLRSSDVPQPNDHYEVRVISGVPVRIRKSLTRFTGSKLKANPEKGKSNQLAGTGMRGERRRVSCRDLGRGDCEGWLWKKKSGDDFSSNGRLTSKWTKRWVVIKDRAIYCYQNNSTDSDQRAECYISLPGYVVTPAPECKRKFAFRICHIKRKTFFFAAERQMDMSRWMNKMGLAAIEYKFDSKHVDADDNKSKDNDYYSESDDDDETNCDVTSISSGPAGANGAVTMLDEVIGNVGDRKIERFHTTTELVSTNFADTSQNRRNSDSLKQSKISTSKRSDAANDVTFEKNSTSVRIKVPDENTSGLGSESVKLSRSLDSLLVSEHPSNLLAVSYQRAKDRAFKWSSKMRRETMTRAERLQIIEDHSISSSEESPLTSSTPLSTSNHERLVRARRLSVSARQRCLSAPTLSAVLSSSESLLPEKEHQATKQLNNNTGKQDESSSLPLADPSPPLARVEILNKMRLSIKKAEVDLLGVNRRVTLRRKMTVLSSDPRINERMLRKRALERELKAKELELAYFEKLLNKDRISNTDLHTWINQHPSLVAEIGTLRRLSNKKRPPLDQASHESGPQVGSNDFQLLNANNSNNRINPRGRPRSSAVSSADLMVPNLQDDMKSKTLPTKPSSSRRRRKLNPNRPLQQSSSTSKPYLETDL